MARDGCHDRVSSAGRRLGFWVLAPALLVSSSGCMPGKNTSRLERQVQQLKDDLYTLRREREDTERRLVALEARLDRLDPTGSASTDPRPRPAEPERTRAAPAAQRDSGGEASDPAYVDGLAAYRAGDYARALDNLAGFVASHPKHRDAADAQFFVAESYFAEANFPQAIVEYQRVVDVYRSSPRVPAALYGIGLSYYELNYEANALNHFDKLVAEHPKSPYADEARPLIEKLRRRSR